MIKKIFFLVLTLFIFTGSVFAAKLPDAVKDFIKVDFPSADFRFDGVIILPDNTIYLPVFPANLLKTQDIYITKSVPDKKKLKDKPDIVVFNNNFCLLKVIQEKKYKTVLRQEEPFPEIKSGLLPQDMLVPKGLKLPANLKCIVGNLKIAETAEPDIKVKPVTNEFDSVVSAAPLPEVNGVVQPLRDKTLYVMSCYSKNIQIIQGEESKPKYALALKGVPIDIKLVNNDKFLLAITYDRTVLDIISLADNQIIKQIDLTTQPKEIVVDEINNVAYISSPTKSLIYVLNLDNMVLKQKIKVNGMCEKLSLHENKLFYTNKKDNELWAIELDNNYKLTDIGNFPNVSSVKYKNENVYMLSRTENKLAISKYKTGELVSEYVTVEKPVDMIMYNNEIIILGAQNGEIQVLNMNDNSLSAAKCISKSFLNSIKQIKGSSLAMVTDIKNARYLVLDLKTKNIVKTNKINIPVSSIEIGKYVKGIND